MAISGNLDPSGFVDELLADDSAGDTADDVADSAEADEEIELDSTRVIYNALSPDGAEHADVVLDKLRHLWTHEPNIASDELAGISAPVLVMAGDRDVIKLEHSRLMALSIPDGQLCIVPGASHALLDERPGFVSFAVQDFLAALPAE